MRVWQLLLVLLLEWAAGQRVGVLWPQGTDVTEAVELATEIYEELEQPGWKATVSPKGDGTVKGAEEAACGLLSEGGLIGFVGPETSSATIFTSFLAARHTIPIVSPTAVASALSADDTSLGYLRRSLPVNHPAAVAAFLASAPELSGAPLAIVHTDDFNGNDITSGMRVELEMLGIRISSVEKLPVTPGEEAYAGLFQSLRDHYIQVVVAVIPVENAGELLTKASENGVFGEGRAWVLTDTSGGADYPAILKGLLGVRPLLPQSRRYHLLAARMDREPSPRARFAFDAAWALLEAAHSTSAHLTPSPPFDCYSDDTWPSGPGVLRFLDNISDPHGAAGLVQLKDNEAHGFEFINLQDAAQKGSVAWRQVGVFTPPTPPILAANAIVWPEGTPPSPSQLLTGQHLHILFIEFEPFVKEVEADNGETRIVGFVVDIVEELKKRLRFDYTAHIDKNGGWSSGIQAVADRKYDMQAADTGITMQREQIVDFTLPYLETSSMLMITHPKNEEQLFRFTRPFATDLWLTLGAVVLLSAAGFYFLEHKAAVKPPSERGGITPYVAPPGKYSVENSVWYACTAFINVQVSEPLTRSGRILALGFFWLSVITIATYTAELAAYLAKQTPVYGADSVNDFMTGKISPSKLGVTPNTVNQYWLEARGLRGYKNVTEDEATAKTIEGSLIATVQDDVWAEWFVQQGDADGACKFELRGPGWNPRGVGLALQKNSPYVDALSQEILEMRESGLLDTMRSEWFIGACEKEEEDEGEGLNLSSFGGVLVMHGVFVAAAILMRVCGHVRERRRKKRSDISHLTNFEYDDDVSLNLNGTKPVEPAEISQRGGPSRVGFISQVLVTSIPTMASTSPPQTQARPTEGLDRRNVPVYSI